MKHTPAPWKITGIANKDIRADHDKMLWIQVQQHTSTVLMNDPGLHQRMEENTRLVCAAPEMAELLKRIAESSSMNSHILRLIQDSRKLLDRIEGKDGNDE